MLSQGAVKEWATKWQTTELNVTRECCQHLMLSLLYQLPASEKIAFKGGTALRLVFGSPRFSEDLDFTANITSYHLKNLLEDWTRQMRQSGIELRVRESQPTSGGHIAIYECAVGDQSLVVSCNVSLRKKAPLEAVLVSSPLAVSYQCLILKTGDLVGEKIQALLSRKKPRDFFDLYFLLRRRLGLPVIIRSRLQLLKAVEEMDARQTQKELRAFLPASFQRVASSLPQTLVSELRRL